MSCVSELLTAFLKQVHAAPLPDDLIQASEGSYSRFMKLADNTFFVESCGNVNIVHELQALSDLAYKKMRSASPTALTAWRILYTDSCILQALIDLSASAAAQSIALLDRAVLIAGGGDEARLALILSLVKKIQQKYLSPLTLSQRVLNKGSRPSPMPLPTAHREVPTINRNTSFLSFQKHFSSSPFVIRGYASDWPALNDNSWNSIDYLLSTSGPARIVPVEVGNDYRDEGWNQVLMEWERFLEIIREDLPESREDPKSLYLAQHNLAMQFPSLREDIVIPDYAYCSLTPSWFPGYKPPTSNEGIILNMWLGPKAAASPAHFDPFYNLYVQIVGSKTVWLASPEKTPYMEAYSPSGRSDEMQCSSPCGNTSSLNTSHLDVFMAQDTQQNFPEFVAKVVPEAMQVILVPGDLLFFPPGWWHGMRSESTSFSVSMWF